MISNDHDCTEGFWRYVTVSDEPVLICAVWVPMCRPSVRSSTEQIIARLRDLPRVNAFHKQTDYVKEEYISFLDSLCRWTDVYLWTGRRWTQVKHLNSAFLVWTHQLDCSWNSSTRSRSKRAWRTFLRRISNAVTIPSCVDYRKELATEWELIPYDFSKLH